MNQYQYQLPNGSWVAATEAAVERMICSRLEMESWMAPRQKRSPMGRNEILAALEDGEEIRTGQDWYDKLRMVPEPLPIRAADTVTCDCGCECNRMLVLAASAGSSCPDCYDRMSE